MMRATLALIAAIGLSAVAASCPNLCSGHGACGIDDTCSCYARWQSADCSQRECPYGLAWIDTATGTNDAHNYAECSNKGLCDTSTGQCECFDGYGGTGCDRTTCVDDCSGHGTCQYARELSSGAYKAWDAQKTRACRCDAGWGGNNCAARACPTGDDPLTTEVDGNSQLTTTSLQLNEVQNVTVHALNEMTLNSGNVTFTYTDLYGGSWTTRPIVLPAAKAYTNTAVWNTGACGVGSSPTICGVTQVAAGMTGVSGTATGDLTGKLIRVTNAAGTLVDTRIITGNDIANPSLAVVASATSSAVGSTYEIQGVLETNMPQWTKVMCNQGDGATAFFKNIDTVGKDGVYTHRMGGVCDRSRATAEFSTEAWAFRKGDWIAAGPMSSAGFDHANCLLQVAEDYVKGSIFLKTVKDDSTEPCLLHPAGTDGAVGTTQIWTQWSPVRSFSDGAKHFDGSLFLMNDARSVNAVGRAITKFDAVTGEIRYEAAAATTDFINSIVPGAWIRLFHFGRPDLAYCDMQVKAFGGDGTSKLDDTDGKVFVDPTSATSTYGNSELCQSWSTVGADASKPYFKGGANNFNVGVAVIANWRYLSNREDALPAIQTSKTEFATVSGVTTVTLTLGAGGAQVLTTAEIESMRVGTLVYILQEDVAVAGLERFYCAGILNADATVEATGIFTMVAAPSTIAGATVQSCSTFPSSPTIGTLAAAPKLRIVVFPQNTVRYARTDPSNVYMFDHLQSGDSVRISNGMSHNAASAGILEVSNGAATYQISHKGTASGAHASSLFFLQGSKPNGGGMHPLMTVGGSTAVTSAHASGNVLFKCAATDRVYLSPTTVIQPVFSTPSMVGTTAATTWTTEDTSMLTSAKDVKRVLEELPNGVIDTVDVAMTSNTVGLYAYSVTFSGTRNTGNQNEIMLNGKGCNLDGCQPRYTGVNIQKAFALRDLEITTGSIKSVLQPDLTSLVDANGGQSLLVYQAGGSVMTGQMIPNVYTTTTEVVSNGLSTAEFAMDTSVLVLSARGDYNTEDNKKYFVSKTSEITRGTKESTECAGRGKCDSEVGECVCYSGYTGNACETQTVLV